MQVFDNLKIARKVYVLLLMLGFVAVGAVVFSAERIGAISGAYEDIIHKDEVASLSLSRAASRFVSVGRDVYMMLPEPAGERRTTLAKHLEKEAEDFNKFAGTARDLFSDDRAAMVSEIITKFNDARKISQQALDLAEKGQNEKALVILKEQYDPEMAAIFSVATKVIVSTGKILEDKVLQSEELTSKTIVQNFVSVGIGLLVVLLLASYLTNAGVSKPIVGLSNVMDQLKNRDFSVEVVGIERRDEVGVMARSIEVFKEGMMQAELLSTEREKARAKQDAQDRRREELGDIFQVDAEKALASVMSAASQLQQTASSMSATAEETSSQATTVAAASEEASTNLQTVASASEELAASIGEISRQVSQSARVAANAAEKSQEANVLIDGLSQSAQKIGAVIKIISDIASQTNLLALNATIEAARAGEAGKGFAVVAGEVKLLASQTGKATDEIAQQVNDVQMATQSTIDAIQGISAIISEVNQISSAIASAIEEQGAATKEITQNVQQASAGSQQVSSTIVGVNEAAANTGHAANDVLNAAASLSRESGMLKSKIQKYIEDLAEVKHS